jgi:hypothetical protein
MLTAIARITSITDCDAGTVILVQENYAVITWRGLLLPRGPIETAFLAAWAERGAGEYALHFDREWRCINANPVVHSNP